jgi:hypothetical protein
VDIHTNQQRRSCDQQNLERKLPNWKTCLLQYRSTPGLDPFVDLKLVGSPATAASLELTSNPDGATTAPRHGCGQRFFIKANEWLTLVVRLPEVDRMVGLLVVRHPASEDLPSNKQIK